MVRLGYLVRIESIKKRVLGGFDCVFSKMSLPRKFGEEDDIKERGCIICLHDGRDLPVTSCCGQEVHEECLLEWLKVSRGKNCPHCRSDMTSVREKKQSKVLILGPLPYEGNVLTTTPLCLL